MTRKTIARSTFKNRLEFVFDEALDHQGRLMGDEVEEVRERIRETRAILYRELGFREKKEKSRAARR